MVEVICRRIGLLVQAHTDPSHPNYQNAKYFTGASTSDEILSPGFRAHVVRRAKEDHELGMPAPRPGLGSGPARPKGTGGPQPQPAAFAGGGGDGDKGGKKGKKGEGARNPAPPAAQ